MATELRFVSPGDQELERRLEAFADVRLTPSAEASARMRAAVMGSIAARPTGILAISAAPSIATTTSTANRRWRRPVAGLMAACLTLSVATGSALAASPGGPLYAARVWTEYLTLPAAGAARTEAEIARLDARIDEAVRASALGDGGAAVAALEAYAGIVAETAVEAVGDPAALSALAAQVSATDPALDRVTASLPSSLRTRALAAIATTAGVVEREHGPATGPRPDPAAGGGSNPGQVRGRPVHDRPDAPAHRPTSDRGAGSRPLTQDRPGHDGATKGNGNGNGNAGANANGNAGGTGNSNAGGNGNGKANGAGSSNAGGNGNGNAGGNGNGNAGGKAGSPPGRSDKGG